MSRKACSGAREGLSRSPREQESQFCALEGLSRSPREQEGLFCALDGLSRSPREQEGLFWRTGGSVEVASGAKIGFPRTRVSDSGAYKLKSHRVSVLCALTATCSFSVLRIW